MQSDFYQHSFNSALQNPSYLTKIEWIEELTFLLLLNLPIPNKPPALSNQEFISIIANFTNKTPSPCPLCLNKTKIKSATLSPLTNFLIPCPTCNSLGVVFIPPTIPTPKF